MKIVKLVGILLVLGIGFGGASKLIDLALVDRDRIATSILFGVFVVVLLVLGVALTLGIIIVQSKVSAGNMFANAQENMALIAQVQKNDAQTLAAQSRATGALASTIGRFPDNQPLNDTTIEDTLIFDANAFSEFE